jgi:hypothetical protein
MIYIIFLLNIRNISVFVYVSVRYPIRIRYPLNIRSVSVFETICIRIHIWKIITDMDTIRALSVHIRSVCNPTCGDWRTRLSPGVQPAFVVRFYCMNLDDPSHSRLDKIYSFQIQNILFFGGWNDIPWRVKKALQVEYFCSDPFDQKSTV